MSTVPNPPQPTTGEYPLSALVPSFIHTFTNQADFLAKTGQVAPPYDTSKPIKLWIDTTKVSASTTIINYTIAVLDSSDQKAVIETLQLPEFVSNAPNIPPDSGPTPVNTNGTLATPIRPLLPGEVLVASPFGISVQNTNVDPVPVVTPSSGLTAQEHAWLSAIFTWTQKHP